MSDISSSSSSTPHRTPRTRRCRKTNLRKNKSSGRKGQAKRFSSCGVVRTPSLSIPKPSLSSPEDLEVDSILQSSSSDDERDVSSSISSDDEDEGEGIKLRNAFVSFPDQRNGDRSRKLSQNIHSVSITTSSRSIPLNPTRVSADLQPRVISNSSTDNVKNGGAKEPVKDDIQVKDNVKESNRLSTESSISSATVTKISHLERLIRTHPLWFQPDLNREDTTILLQGKEDGVCLSEILSKLLNIMILYH